MDERIKAYLLSRSIKKEDDLFIHLFVHLFFSVAGLCQPINKPIRLFNALFIWNLSESNAWLLCPVMLFVTIVRYNAMK